MPFSCDEIGLLSEKKIFEVKTSATEKLKALMMALRQDLLGVLTPENLLVPNGVDFTHGQIAKGENHDGYPYVVMDFPKYYTKTDMFSFRVFFWFGHGLFFAAILAGNYLPHYLRKLDEQYACFAEHELLFGKETLWDWQAACHLQMKSETKAEILQRAEAQNFLKVMRFFEPEILNHEAKLREAYREFYQTVEKIILK